MNRIGWGMIGCGDVTQVKSGPAFQKVESSFIAAVMSRSIDKARFYAQQNNIADFYDDVDLLLANPLVNAVYIATPPSTHEQYALMAIQAGKHVYIEKPMALNYISAEKIAAAARKAGVKLVVAHYRREQPIFKKMKQLIDEGMIGKVRLAVCNYEKIAQTHADLQIPANAWRVDPAVSGGGLFHDLAPHQLDLMLYFFGAYTYSSGYARNQMQLHKADDIVCGTILFENDVVFSGNWLFNGARYVDEFIIHGARGRITFATFQHEAFHLEKNGITDIYRFENLPHVQMPLINQVVSYFLDQRENPCDADNGVDVMRIIDSFTTKP